MPALLLCPDKSAKHNKVPPTFISKDLKSGWLVLVYFYGWQLSGSVSDKKMGEAERKLLSLKEKNYFIKIWVLEVFLVLF